MHVPPVDPDDLSPGLRATWESASDGGKRFVQAMANAPAHAERLFPYYTGVRFGTRIGIRLCELLRLAIAQTTRCPNCLAGRVDAAGLSEDLIAAIPEFSGDDFTPRELAVMRFAFTFGSDHFALGEDDFRELYRHFDVEEVTEIGMLCAQFLGFGRLAMVMELEHASCPIPVRREPVPVPAGAGAAAAEGTVAP